VNETHCRAQWGTTSRAHGSFQIPPSADVSGEVALSARWNALTGRPTVWLRQVHGTNVAFVASTNLHIGHVADAAVTNVAGVALGIVTADCAPVVFLGRHSVGIAHAGWRGLLGGVVEKTVEAMTVLGEEPESITAALGPCVHRCCYEFGVADLHSVAEKLGANVISQTSRATPSLDIVAGVQSVVSSMGVPNLTVSPQCTACHADPSNSAGTYYSWRRNQDAGRQGTWVALNDLEADR
jgi:polyphenol oxidase